ncbi:molybdenum cofactor guanylyltransferase [Alteromonas mediterranea]|uniref:molybdenum cofactor guanylyltransferase n=1 Tax=Alteromonas mediterranea TaxID=314275 RepID=UPI001131AA4A|nr:molybdenum cofactor guanylyltransferase [Alteromonas mediterranea]QDG38254.1 molybdenum cofactor guanylyltransferase [Alteromonas mediterranea]
MLFGVVLAGGASRRMGQDKALMQFNGRTLITHASQLLASAGCQHVLVSRNQDGYINDKIKDVGPLGGVHSAVCEVFNDGAFTQLKNASSSETKESALLVLPVDMPQMTPAFLKQLVALGRKNRRACYVENRFLPFYLPVDGNTIASLNNYLVTQNKRKVVGFLGQVNAVEISLSPDEDDAPWLNVNTPGDWPLSV